MKKSSFIFLSLIIISSAHANKRTDVEKRKEQIITQINNAISEGDDKKVAELQAEMLRTLEKEKSLEIRSDKKYKQINDLNSKKQTINEKIEKYLKDHPGVLNDSQQKEIARLIAEKNYIDQKIDSKFNSIEKIGPKSIKFKPQKIDSSSEKDAEIVSELNAMDAKNTMKFKPQKNSYTPEEEKEIEDELKAREIMKFKAPAIDLSPEEGAKIAEDLKEHEIRKKIKPTIPDATVTSEEQKRIEKDLKALDAQCADGKEELNLNQEAVNAFMQKQGELTLHKLAWAYLNQVQTKSDGEVERVEQTIERLLKEQAMSMEKDPKFKEAADAFSAAKLSRKSLYGIMPYLLPIFNKQKEASPEQSRFLLGSADVKIVGFMAEHEADKNSYLFSKDTSVEESVINLLKLINSSYNNQESGKILTSKEQIEANKARLQEKISSLQKDLKSIIPQVLCSEPSGPNKEACVDESLVDMDFTSQTEAILQKLSSSTGIEDIDKELRYGKFWLSVRRIKK